MNFSVILRNVVNAVKNAGGKTLVIARAHAPEILVATGIAGFTGTVIGACKATAKAHDILEEKEHALEVIDEAEAALESGTPLLKDHQELYRRMPTVQAVERDTRKRIFLCYLPVATAGIASGLLILWGFRIVNGRFIATAAAYKTLEASYDRYRGNVTREFGSEVDWRMLNSIDPDGTDRRLVQPEQEETGEKGLIKKEPLARNNRSDAYAVIFDAYSDRWQNWWSPHQVWEFLARVENEMNDLLQIRKVVFLNEIYEALGLKWTTEGQVVGWVLDKNHPDTRIKLGLDDIPENVKREFLKSRSNGEISIWVRPNPMGVVYRSLGKPDNERW